MSRDVLVTLFVTVVLGNIVKIITTNDQSTLHLGRGDNTSQDTTLNVDFTNERTLLVNISTSLGFLGGLETITDFLEPTLVTLLGVLGVLENTSLLLEGLFGLLIERVLVSKEYSSLLRAYSHNTYLVFHFE